MSFFKKAWGPVSAAVGLPFIGSTALGMGADIFSAYSAAQSQKDSNSAMQLNAREQMNFQERMSSTAHQREVDDLRKAGLNPLLSANSGASTPGGAMAASDPVPGIGASVVGSAKQNMALMADIQNTRSDTEIKQKTSKLLDRQISEAGSSAKIAELDAWAKENSQAIVRKYPKTFGWLDAISQRLGLFNSGAGVARYGADRYSDRREGKKTTFRIMKKTKGYSESQEYRR